MEKSAHYYIVGLFVTAAFFALIGFSIWLMSPHDEKDNNFYTVYFTDPINGVDEGTAVTYRGMNVGKVQKVRLDPKKSDLIKVDIAVAKRTPVRENTRAVLEAQGLTGLIHLDLSTKPEDTDPPEKVTGEKYPVLQGEPSQISKILDGISRFTTEGSEAAVSLHQLSNQLRTNPSQLIFGASKTQGHKANNNHE